MQSGLTARLIAAGFTAADVEAMLKALKARMRRHPAQLEGLCREGEGFPHDEGRGCGASYGGAMRDAGVLSGEFTEREAAAMMGDPRPTIEELRSAIAA